MSCKNCTSFIDTIEGEKVEDLCTLLIDDMEIDARRKKIVVAERNKYLKGEGRSFSRGKVKEMAINKNKRHAMLL